MPSVAERIRSEGWATPRELRMAGALQSKGSPVFYVYLLRSESWPSKTYVGFTADLKSRLADHNAGRSSHTARFRPWKLECYLGFADESAARAFEGYLKTSSGVAFARKRFCRIASTKGGTTRAVEPS